jgi:hypothetical protein
VIFTTRPGTWGTRYLGKHEVLGFFWPLLFAAFFGPDPDIAAVPVFWSLSVVMLLLHRIKGVQLRAKGYRCHSLYWGESLLERDDGACGEKTARGRICLLTILVGFGCLVGISAPLGVLMMIGGFAKAVSEEAVFQAMAARVRQMEDARFESERDMRLLRERESFR